MYHHFDMKSIITAERKRRAEDAQQPAAANGTTAEINRGPVSWICIYLYLLELIVLLCPQIPL